MSEYQYYHFQAIGQPLSEQQMDELRRISTRAEITPASFVNVYNFGDLKADPRDLMRRYFDAHVYTANWGTHRFMLKIPRDLMDLDTAEQYCGESLDMYVGKEHVILDFVSEDESGVYYDEMDTGEGWMASLIPLREDIMRGDLRALYVGWLAGIAADDETEEPLMPPGMSQLSGPLQNFARFLRINTHVLEAALQGAPEASPVGPSHDETVAWVTSLPNAEKDEVLLTLLTADTDSQYLGSRLRQRFHKEWRQAHLVEAQDAAQSARTAGQLWQLGESLAEAARRKKAEQEAQARAERERKAVGERRQHLASLATREAGAWQQVDALLSTTVQKNYDEAVTLLCDLRDLATDRGYVPQWEARITEFRQRYARKSSLMQRFNKAHFP